MFGVDECHTFERVGGDEDIEGKSGSGADSKGWNDDMLVGKVSLGPNELYHV